jgi:hypothetical protein
MIGDNDGMLPGITEEIIARQRAAFTAPNF